MSEALFYNSLNLLTSGDYKKLSKLMEKFGGWEKAWRSRSEKNTNPEKEWARLEGRGVKLFLRNDAEYPPLLREMPFPPFGIYVLGDIPGKSFFAIVGTRKATPEGKALAKKFSAELTGAGLAVASGLALGIDAAAHEGCLSCHGKTIAVLANGLDRFYPAANEALARRILENGGAIISEYPLGSEPLPYRFLERNRIVSGLSRGVLVIEAPENSGSLATARFALEQNRDVFVVPGPVSHPNFRGSHELIRQGATLVTKPAEILEGLGMESEAAGSPAQRPETENEKIIFGALQRTMSACDVDKIIEMTKLSAIAANQALTTLTIKNIIKEGGGGYTLN